MTLEVLTNANGLGVPQTWLQIATTGTPPPERTHYSSVHDQTNNRVIIFGGGQISGGTFSPLFNDVWVLTHANGLGGTSEWIQLAPGGPAPAPREGHRAVYDPSSNRMIIFGGGNNGIMSVPNDVWVLTNANGLGGIP